MTDQGQAGEGVAGDRLPGSGVGALVGLEPADGAIVRRSWW
jgi:hypothetical protein